MDKNAENRLSWEEFDKKKREREFYDGLEADEMERSWPYTPFEKWKSDREKDDYLNGVSLTKKQLFEVIKESVKLILKENFNIGDFIDFPDEWISSLASNGEKMGLTPSEIETLIKKRMKEQDDYEIEQLNKREQNDNLRRSGESAMEKRANGVSYGSNGSIKDDSLWKR